ncbi:MAG TPA: head GIN domain-containing protein [Bacteroidia bacterium]|nr:head GIN domain-containing protein [Bacteroidia bacterium]
MNYYSKLIAVLFAAVLLNTCNVVCTEGTGPMQTDKREPGSFTEIELELSADVTVMYGETPALIIEAHENFIDKINTKIRGNRLTISNEGCFNSKERIKITAYMPELEGLEVDGSGNMNVPDTFKVKDISLQINGSGDIKGKFIAAKIESDIRGSGNLVLAGSANKHTMEILGSGDIKASDLPCNSTEVNVSGSGDVFVYTIQNLDVKINGSGTVHYKGKPSVNSSVNGSGKVVDEN